MKQEDIFKEIKNKVLEYFSYNNITLDEVINNIKEKFTINDDFGYTPNIEIKISHKHNKLNEEFKCNNLFLIEVSGVIIYEDETYDEVYFEIPYILNKDINEFGRDFYLIWYYCVMNNRNRKEDFKDILHNINFNTFVLVEDEIDIEKFL